MITVKEGYIPVADGRVWYRITGADRSTVPLLCLHGGPGAPHDYLETMEGFSTVRPVIFYDQMGCGNSKRPGDPDHWTIQSFVDELEQVRNALGLPRVHILGQSWGTILSFEYMIRKKPAGVVSLVQSGPVMSFPIFENDQKEALKKMPEEYRVAISAAEESGDFSGAEYEAAMDLFYREHLCRLDPWPDAMVRTMDKIDHDTYMYMQGPSEFTITGTLKGYDRIKDLGSLELPVLYTCGEFDECTPSATEFYSRMTPGSEFIVFAGASHEHHMEKPDEYIDRVGEFLKRVETEV